MSDAIYSIVLVFSIIHGSVQQQQNSTQRGECFMRISASDSNGQNVAAGGRTIMYDEPCVGFDPHGGSHTNSGRREGCRKAAEQLAQGGAKPECGQIVHGQCLQAQAQSSAACYVLAKLPNGGFRLKLLKECADGVGYIDPYVQNQMDNNQQNGGGETGYDETDEGGTTDGDN